MTRNRENRKKPLRQRDRGAVSTWNVVTANRAPFADLLSKRDVTQPIGARRTIRFALNAIRTFCACVM